METDCPPGGTGHCNNDCPFWKNSKCCPPEHPDGVCRRCQGKGTIQIDLFKDMGLNRAERRRRLKDDSQRYKYIPCPDCLPPAPKLTVSREILTLKRRDDGIFEIYTDGKLVEEYEANENTSAAILPIKLWRHFNQIIEDRITTLTG